ncbi:MAG: Ig-like domain-containing protein, partial [Acidobacteriota bacterium]
MFASAPRKFHSLLIAPSLFTFLFWFGPSAPINQAPVAVDDTYTIHGCPASLTPDVTANDSDPDGDPISITGFPQLPAHGGVSRSGNHISYCPNYGYFGPDNFIYQICDNQNACTSGNVSLNLVNQHPNGVADAYNVHGSTVVGPFLINDSDPDGDPVSIGDASHSGIVTFPQHGSITGISQPDKKLYSPNYGYTGADSFTYNVCDGLGLCTETTVNINVINQPPNGGADSYDVHGATVLGPFLVNDSDPDGDAVTIGDANHEGIATFPQHGSLTGIIQPDKKLYSPTSGYTGPDSFTYNVCDGFGLCTQTTVNLNVINNPPIAGNDSYTIRGTTTIGPLRVNDSDPDGDSLSDPVVTVPASHGTVSGLSDPDFKSYTPVAGYFGSDTFTYQVCDGFGACANATVTLTVLATDALENCGAVSCNANVGGPVNVTNGNMYLQQSDYLLPGIGPAVNVTRTYNSMSQTVGLFGKGWSTAYDESIKVNSSTYVRWFRADGQATNFMRASGSGPFSSV